MKRRWTPTALAVFAGVLMPWPLAFASGEDLPLRVLLTNDFEHYDVGSLAGQHGWTAASLPGSASVIDDPAKMGEVVADPLGVTHTYLYHDLDAVGNTGEVAFRVDARHTGSSGWAYFVVGDSGLGGTNFAPSAALFGFNNNRFLVRPGNGSGGFGTVTSGSGALADPNTWYTFVTTMQFTGPASNTWNLEVFERDTENLVWDYSGAGFTTNNTAVTDVGVFVSSAASTLYFDNFRMANVNATDDVYPINRITHGDFDRIEAGTWPDNTARAGGWRIHRAPSAHGEFKEADAGYITIAQKPGADPGDHALRINVPASNSNPVFAEQLLSEPWSDTDGKLILTHEHVTNADGTTYTNNGNWTFVNGGHGAVGPYVGLHDRPANSGHKIRYWGDGVGEKTLADYTPGETYQFRTSVDMQTKKFDLFVRGGPEFLRWTQIGKQLPFLHAGTSVLDRVQFGEFHNRTTDAYIDNVVVVSSEDLPQWRIHYTDDFQQYNLGNLVGQHGWTGTVTSPGTALIVDEAGARMSRLDPGGAFTHLYHDFDAVADAGQVAFRVDARHTGSNWAYFVLGDSDLGKVAGKEFDSSTAVFGFHNNQFLVRPGHGTGGWDPHYFDSDVTFDPNKWYTFLATMNLTGPDRNTWGLQVFDRETQDLVWSYAGAGFTTNFTNLTRLGMFSNSAGTLYFDNLWLANVPEPATAMLLALGLPLLLLRRKRR